MMIKKSDINNCICGSTASIIIEKFKESNYTVDGIRIKCDRCNNKNPSGPYYPGREESLIKEWYEFINRI